MAITTALATSWKKELLQGHHSFTAGGTVTGTPTNTSPTVTGVSSVTNLIPGMSVSGTNIPASTVIASVDSSSQFTMSKNATGSPGSITITYGAGDTHKLALYTSAATLDATTTAYSATNEASGTGYTAGGSALTNITFGSRSMASSLCFCVKAWRRVICQRLETTLTWPVNSIALSSLAR